ncbi:hypothetical protein B0H15DRAFT_830313 [Mycena belliarum]|uniref:Uncharacterized protein n=1 Tax=Mycena belliarum TaxID=1033014 RepID=A0AAD6U9I6_9AGAR|nr:hypothetical protein B0H15DRAFT_830313 [Mycena belliae]
MRVYDSSSSPNWRAASSETCRAALSAASKKSITVRGSCGVRSKRCDVIRSLVLVVEGEEGGAGHGGGCAPAPAGHGGAVLSRGDAVGRHSELLPLREVDVGDTGGRRGRGVEDGLLIGRRQHELGDRGDGRRGGREGWAGGGRAVRDGEREGPSVRPPETGLGGRRIKGPGCGGRRNHGSRRALRRGGLPQIPAGLLEAQGVRGLEFARGGRADAEARRPGGEDGSADRGRGERGEDDVGRGRARRGRVGAEWTDRRLGLL